MRAIRFFIISILILFLLITGIGLLLPGHVTISRAIDILADRERVHALLADPNRWKTWFPGADSLPLVKRAGQPTGIQMANGGVICLRSVTDTLITLEGLQAASIDGDMGFRLLRQNPKDPVTLQWYIEFRLDGYPWERFSSLLLENKFGPLMEQGLKRVQQEAQSSPSIP